MNSVQGSLLTSVKGNGYMRQCWRLSVVQSSVMNRKAERAEPGSTGHPPIPLASTAGAL